MEVDHININTRDVISKRILSNKTLLSFILKELCEDFKNMDRKKIEESISDYSDNDPLGLPLKIRNENNEEIELDVLINYRFLPTGNEIGMYLNLEMQKYKTSYSLLDRAVYYASGLLFRQKGETFTKSNYSDIKKVYSIWICPNPPSELRNSIIEYCIRPKILFSINQIKAKEYKKYNILFINLGKDDKRNIDTLKVMNMIFKHSSTQTDNVKNLLKDNYNIILSKEEVDSMTAFEESVFEHGKDMGKAEGKIETIISMINFGIPKKDAYKIANATDEIIDAVEQMLSQDK